MADRLAIKRLTASDCTLFEAVFRQIDAGNQKSINLNADVLVGQLYPSLAATAALTDNEIALSISIHGPGAKTAHSLSRKIIKNPSYKNWRLNGEFIMGPPSDPSRYDDIRPGDLAIMAFRGLAAPSGMDLILVSQAAPADAALLDALTSLFGNRSMIEVTAAQLAEAATIAAVPEVHPVRMAAADPEMDAALEDAAQGGADGIGKLLRRRTGRPVSLSDLAKAKIRAERVGREGEGLVNAYLAAKILAGHLAAHRWVSAENAVAPFDFETFEVSGERTLIDAKSTTGPFDNVIHVSIAEVIEATGGTPYRIYRVFNLTDDGAKLRISDDIRTLAQSLRKAHDTHMPPGVRIDGFSLLVSALTWGPEDYIERPDDEGLG